MNASSKPLIRRLAERSMLPVEIVQLTEHRHCTCGRVYSAPNNSLLVRFRAKQGKATSVAALAAVKLQVDCISLPRVHQDIHTDVEACEACFMQCGAQLPLFPQYEPRELRMGSSGHERISREDELLDTPVRVNGKKAVVATSLDEF